MAEGSDDPKSQKKPDPTPEPERPTTPAIDSDAEEGERTPPEGVDEQVDADDNKEALHDIGITEEEIRAAFRAGILARTQARRFLYPWHVRGMPSAYSFDALSELKVADGWGFRPFGNVAWLRKPDGRYGVVVWPGDRNTGNPRERARNLRAKGDDWKMLLSYLSPTLPMEGLDPPSVDEDDELEGDVPPRPLSNDWPREFVVILRQRVGDFIRLELQVIGPHSLDKEGYLDSTRLRIMLSDLDVSHEVRGQTRSAAPTPPTPPAPPSGPELDVKVERTDAAAGPVEGDEAEGAGGDKT